MKDMLLLLFLLCAQTIKVCSTPYKSENGQCHNDTEYMDSGLCCTKCRPGYRRGTSCTETTDTVCTPCPPDQYQENFNYYPNCATCQKCREEKGLQYAQSCSSTTPSKCICRPGRYCIMGYDDPYCSDCRKYKQCRPGTGVTAKGTPSSDVKCKPCPEGTFSDKTSSTDPCQPHTDCNGRAVLRKGNTTSDTVCEPYSTADNHKKGVGTTPSTSTTTVAPSSGSTAPLRSTAQSISVSEESSTYLITSRVTQQPDSKYVIIIASVTGFLIITIPLLILFLLCYYQKICKKDTASLSPKVDANGNCETADEKYTGKTQLSLFKVASQENECLLEKGEASSDHSHCTTNTETLTRTDGCSSQESISPLHSTFALDNPLSVLSEPMTLLSNIESAAPQPSIQTQTSSQPSSPQIITPMTTSPHVNVNITLHIGNGSCGTPAFIPADLIKPDCKLPYGEEEESFSTPQQEDGKQSLMSVPESSTYCTEHTEQDSYA
ncbi:tumor necrosis factor receptor superfamily member 1B precursor [Oreochromis niloticus]|nr:tumor necrosis factor receptor superfamily member 1B precursor [Oreochromis niloticus]AJF23298.1 tumor necrosis factor receptor superfamily member [Oreochromis niloticus]